MATKERDITGFCPDAFLCIICKNMVSMIEDSFMKECCGNKLICNLCAKGIKGEHRCVDCGKKLVSFRIKGSFFSSIVQDAANWKAENEGNQKRGQSNQNCTAKKPTIFTMIYEDFPIATKALQVSSIIQTIMVNHKHTENCQPYHNMNYFCEMFCKLARVRGAAVTIHDMLAFVCLFCGHGSMNAIALPKGEKRKMGFHSMFECSLECCGKFLDRRTLQYTGGNCDCRIKIIRQLGVKPATDIENGWRRDLFIGKGSSIQNFEVKDMLKPTLQTLGISKPQLLVWFIMSQGIEMVEAIRGLTPELRLERISQLVLSLNGEFGRQSPIQ